MGWGGVGWALTNQDPVLIRRETDIVMTEADAAVTQPQAQMPRSMGTSRHHGSLEGLCPESQKVRGPDNSLPSDTGLLSCRRQPRCLKPLSCGPVSQWTPVHDQPPPKCPQATMPTCSGLWCPPLPSQTHIPNAFKDCCPRWRGTPRTHAGRPGCVRLSGGAVLKVGSTSLGELCPCKGWCCGCSGREAGGPT